MQTLFSKFFVSCFLSGERFETTFYGPGGRHYSNTIYIGEYTTKIGQKLLIGDCFKCDGNKSTFVDDNTIQVWALGLFCKHLLSAIKAGEKLTTNKMKNPARPLVVVAKIGSAAVSKCFKAVYLKPQR